MRMKKFSYAALLLAVVLLGAVLVGVMWQSSPRTTQDFLSRGKAYYEDKKYAEATVDFLNALQRNPRHREARYVLVQALLAQKNALAAVRQLKPLLEYYPDDKQARLELGNIYLTGGHQDAEFFRQAQQIA